MIKAAVILVTSIKSMIDTIASAIPISLNPVSFLVQMTLDAVALAVESFG
jgi:hypothetical protein